MFSKKIIAMMLSVAMLAMTVLGGCGSSTAPATSTPAGDAGSAASGASGEVTEVVVWNQIFEEWNQEFFTQKAEEYNALNRGYKVTQEFIPGDAWNDRMTTAQASGTAPDTYVIAYNNLLSASRKGLIQPLDGLISQEAIDDILPNVKEMVSFDGHVWAYPQLIEPSAVLFYRTDLFEAAGIAGPPKSWDELIAAANKLKTNEVFGLGIAAGAQEMGWSTWGWQYGTTGHLAINDNWDAPTLDGYKDLANFYKRCYDEGVVPAQSLAGYGDVKPFGEGALAMQISGSWGVAQLLNTYPEMADKFAVAPTPTMDGNQDKTTATNGGWTYVIDAKAKNAAGAADYISWLLGEDPATCGEFFKLAQFSKSAPRISVQEWVNKEAGDSTWAAAINDVSSHAIPEPVYPWDISTTVTLMFENVYSGAMNVDDAMAQAEQSIKDIIATQGLAGTNPQMSK